MMAQPKRSECKHLKYATSISARKAAEAMGLKARNVVNKCEACGKYRVVP